MIRGERIPAAVVQRMQGLDNCRKAAKKLPGMRDRQQMRSKMLQDRIRHCHDLLVSCNTTMSAFELVERFGPGAPDLARKMGLGRFCTENISTDTARARARRSAKARR